MKKTITAISLILAASTAGAAELVEAIVIRVGDRIVTSTHYQKRLRDGLNELQMTAPAGSTPEQIAAKKDEFRKSLTEDLVSELLVKDRADRLGLSITDAEVREALVRMREQYGIKTDEQFEESLRSAGMTRADMETRLRDTLLSNKVFQRELRSREELTDRELKERYDREKEHYRLPERVRLREIIVPRPENAAAAAAVEARAAQIAKDARVAPDFAKFASSVPENVMKENGGDMGEVARGELLPELDKAVFDAQAGAVLGPILAKSSWHIIKVEQKLPTEVPAFESVKEKLRKDVSDETFQRDYKAYIERLRKDAFIELNEKNIPKV